MTLSLRANLPVDDTDPDIFYSAGNWQEQTGSSRQFDSNVHLTNTFGATISFSYSGQAFVLYGTIPAGSNNVIIDVSIDGGSPTTVTKACESDEQFHVDFFESPVVAFDVHSVVITNRGRSTDASFMFDNLVLYSDDIIPSMTSRPMLTTPTPTSSRIVPQSVSTTRSPSSTPVSQASTSSTTSSTTPSTITSVSSSPQTSTESGSVSNSSTPAPSTSESTTTFLTTDSQGSTIVFTQTFTTSFLASSQTASVAAVGSSSHIGTVMAGVFGGLAFLLLIIVAFLVLRRRRKNTRALVEEDKRGLVLKKSRSGRSLVIPQPFRLSTPRNPASPDTSPLSDHSPSMSEKLAHRKYSTRNANRDNSPESEPISGPSSGDQVPSHAPFDFDRGFSSAAQSDLAANILSHRRSASVANVADREAAARPHSPTMSSMYMSSTSGDTYDAPPAYQPPLTGIRTSEFKTRSQLYNDHTSHPPGEGD